MKKVKKEKYTKLRKTCKSIQKDSKEFKSMQKYAKACTHVQKCCERTGKVPGKFLECTYLECIGKVMGKYRESIGKLHLPRIQLD